MATGRSPRVPIQPAAEVAQECGCVALIPKTALQMATSTVAEVDHKSNGRAPKN